MDTISFDRLLLKTAFCCMAADGSIDKREIAIIDSLCEKSPLFRNFNFHEEVNKLVGRINKDGKNFIKYYFDLLKNTVLTEEEELILLDFAIQTIKGDAQVHYSEIKFFKNIRHRLKVTDDVILKRFPEIEEYLEEDIITDEFLDKITGQYFESTELPQFELLDISKSDKEE